MSEYIFKLPDLGEGLVEAEIAEWMVKPGDQVEEEDAIAAVLTDKAAVELSAPVTGRVTSLAGEVGDTIAVGTPLIVFETSAEIPVEEETPVETPTETPAEVPINAPVEAAVTNKVLTSPSVRRQAREAGIDLGQVTGTGPRGRILRADLEAFLQAGPGDEQAVAGKPSTKITDIKVIGLRRKIAERMTRANRDVPHFAYVEEIDITALESLRRHLNDRKAAGEDKLTLLPFIGMALARTLKNFPQCNALYDPERNVISQYEAVHLGIATQTADGLKVPVVRDSDTRQLENLAAEIRRVTTAARDNTATREELMGSTITITSLGKAGGIASTPVINLPEVAIIGVNKAVERPVVSGGQIVVRRMMNLSSSFDHRFVDGYDGAMLIQALKEMLEQPATIFMND
ncbi:MAG: 2-oxo acid dehydrogenase subunit E2 [Xanthomonadales bacterium]|nr:2-oxo acid dehydrogenase subunit E2 [Xanthomonadales bacterium]